MTRAIHVRVMAVRRFVLHVRNGNGDAALALFRRVVNRIKRAELHLGVVLAQHLGNRRRQRRLAMVNVTNGPDVHVRLIALEFLLGHIPHALCFRSSAVPQLQKLWSGGRDLNPQPSPWKSETLPLSYPRPPAISTANFPFPATI